MAQFVSMLVFHAFTIQYATGAEFAAESRSQYSVKVPLQMGCYGIGVTRIMSAAAQLSSQSGLRLPLSIAPFTVGVVTPKQGSHEFQDGYSEAMQIAHELDKVPSRMRLL